MWKMQTLSKYNREKKVEAEPSWHPNVDFIVKPVHLAARQCLRPDTVSWEHCAIYCCTKPLIHSLTRWFPFSLNFRVRKPRALSITSNHSFTANLSFQCRLRPILRRRHRHWTRPSIPMIQISLILPLWTLPAVPVKQRLIPIEIQPVPPTPRHRLLHQLRRWTIR